MNDKSILSNFTSFLGKYLPVEIKKEEISLIKFQDDLMLIKIDYYSSYQMLNSNIKYDYRNASYYSSSMYNDSESQMVRN